jgi:hypothetical protein
MYYYPIARKLENWWKAHSKWDDPEWAKWNDTFNTFMQDKIKELLTKHENILDGKKVLGLSSTGSCSRRANMAFKDIISEGFSGSDLFTFWLGHAVEVAALATLDSVGYDVGDRQARASYPNLFSSAIDGEIDLLGYQTPVSVKSAGYKMSGVRRNKGQITYLRKGFPELPFSGVRNTHPGYWAQLQMEMFARKREQGLFLFVAKDIIKAFENDNYMGKNGNGSLVFYTEFVKPDKEVVEVVLESMEQQKKDNDNGIFGEPRYLINDEGRFKHVVLNKAEYHENDIWGGKNKAITKTFNPCGGCPARKPCLELD